MPTYLVLADVESPEPFLVKVRAASFNDAEFRVMQAYDIPYKSRILGVWDLAQVEDVARHLPRKAGSFSRRPVPVRRYVRRSR